MRQLSPTDYSKSRKVNKNLFVQSSSSSYAWSYRRSLRNCFVNSVCSSIKSIFFSTLNSLKVSTKYTCRSNTDKALNHPLNSIFELAESLDICFTNFRLITAVDVCRLCLRLTQPLYYALQWAMTRYFYVIFFESPCSPFSPSAFTQRMDRFGRSRPQTQRLPRRGDS